MYAARKLGFPLLLIFAGLVFTGIVTYWASIPKDWNDAVKENVDGTYALSDDWTGVVDAKKEQYTNHQLYMLVASAKGYFLCNHCPTGRFFLHKGEVYRYGTTGLGKSGRGYSEKWLNDNLLTYVHITTTDLATAKTQETSLIGAYAILPENLNRPVIGSLKTAPGWYRLVLPPGNNSLD